MERADVFFKIIIIKEAMYMIKKCTTEHLNVLAIYFRVLCIVKTYSSRGYRFCQLSKEGTDMDIHHG